MTKVNKNKSSYELEFLFSRWYLILTLVLVIVILTLGYLFLISPKWEIFSAGGQFDLNAYKSDLEKRQAYLNELSRLAANYKKVSQTDLEKLKYLLPEQKDLPGLFVQLQNLAEENDFLLSGITINEAGDSQSAADGEAAKAGALPAGIKKLSISLSLAGSSKGDYGEVKKILEALEKNLRLFDVSAVYFSPDNSSYTVNLFTYYTSTQ